MVRRLNAHVRNGVAVPDEQIALPEGRHVVISFDDAAVAAEDPLPAAGLAALEWVARHRIVLPPEAASDIITNKEHLEQEADDAP